MLKWVARLPVIEKTIVLIVVALVCGGIIKSAYYTIRYGGTDLRVRVVGARVMSTDKSPYFYKWKTGDPERLADPNDVPTRSVNGVSVAPGLLYLQRLFSWMEYPLLRIIWTGFQYLLALYVFCSLLWQQQPGRSRTYIIAIGGLFFLSGPIWFLNIERGQIYIFFPFVFCLLYQLYSLKKPLFHFLFGALLVLIAYCRPTCAIIMVPFLLVLNRWVLSGIATGSIFAGIHAFLNIQLWQDYFSAMAIYTGIRADKQAPINQVPPAYPEFIEGVNNITMYKTDMGVGGITPISERINEYLQPVSNLVYIMAYVVLALLFLLLFRKRVQGNGPVALILLGFLLYICTEYIMPAPRAGYNLIEWLFPVLLMLQKDGLSPRNIILLITGLCLTTAFPYFLPYLTDVGELLLVFCLIDCLWNYRLPERIIAPAPDNIKTKAAHR